MKNTIIKIITVILLCSFSGQAAQSQNFNQDELKNYLRVMRSLGHDGTINFYSTWDKTSKKRAKKQIQQALDFAKFKFGDDLSQTNILAKNTSLEEKEVCTKWDIVKTQEAGYNSIKKSSQFSLSNSAGLSTSVAAAAAGLFEIGSLVGLGSFGLVGGLFGSLGVGGAGSASFDGFFDFGVSNSNSSHKVNYYYITRDVKCTDYTRMQRAKVSITPDLTQTPTKLIAQTSYKKLFKLTQFMTQRTKMIQSIIEVIIENPVISLQQVQNSLSKNNSMDADELSKWIRLNSLSDVTVSTIKSSMDQFGLFMVRELKKQLEIISDIKKNNYLINNFQYEINEIESAHDSLITLISRLENNELTYVVKVNNQTIGPLQSFNKYKLSLIELRTISHQNIITNSSFVKNNYPSIEYKNYLELISNTNNTYKLFKLGLTKLPSRYSTGWVESLIESKEESFWTNAGYVLKKYNDVYDNGRIYNEAKYNQIKYELDNHNCRVYHYNYHKDSVDIICPTNY